MKMACVLSGSGSVHPVPAIATPNREQRDTSEHRAPEAPRRGGAFHSFAVRSRFQPLCFQIQHVGHLLRDFVPSISTRCVKLLDEASSAQDNAVTPADAVLLQLLDGTQVSLPI